MNNIKKKKARKPILSLFRSKIEDQNYQHNANLNRDLDTFGVKLIKIVGVFGIVVGIAILGAFWVWVIRWLYQIW